MRSRRELELHFHRAVWARVWMCGQLTDARRSPIFEVAVRCFGLQLINSIITPGYGRETVRRQHCTLVVDLFHCGPPNFDRIGNESFRMVVALSLVLVPVLCAVRSNR